MFSLLTFSGPASSIIGEGIQKRKHERKTGGRKMKTVKISLNSIDKVKSFVNDITKFDYDFDLVSGRYVIDAKSIMGIFSLDLSKPIDLNIHAEENVDDVLAILKNYEV